MKTVGDPAKQFVFMKYRTDQHHILLVRRPHPRVIGKKHIAIFDAGVVRSVLQNPFDLGIGHPGHVLHVRPEKNKFAVFRQDGWVQIKRIHRHRRSGQALDSGSVLFVDIPETVANHFIRDGINLAGRFAMQFEFV